MKQATQTIEAVQPKKRPGNGIHDENPFDFPDEVLQVMKLHTQHKLFSPKYFPSQKQMIIREVHELFKKEPALSAKQVVLTILADLPDFLPSWNIHRVTGYITQTWRELSNAEEAPETNE